MVWDCITLYGFGDLVGEGNINYMDYINILDRNLKHSIQNIYGNQICDF